MENYELVKTIAKGSFGLVSHIRRKSDGKDLVWKELNYGLLSEKEKKLIVTEVNLLRELRHPYIVRYHDRVIDKENTKIYIVMEYCQGGDLGQLIKSHKRSGDLIPEELIWRIFSQILLALKACHRHVEGGVTKSILHRDIKPGNIFLDSHNNAKLGDFGLAKELGAHSRLAQTNVGTPYYMSPEMVNEEDYDERSDIWALGCLIYEMASLVPPFDAKNHVALAKKISQGTYPRIPTVYSSKLFQVIQWMIQPDKHQRPRVEDLAQHDTLSSASSPSSLSPSSLSTSSSSHHSHTVYTQRLQQLVYREEAVTRRESKLTAARVSLKADTDALRQRERCCEAWETSLSINSNDNQRTHHAFQTQTPHLTQQTPHQPQPHHKLGSVASMENQPPSNTTTPSSSQARFQGSLVPSRDRYSSPQVEERHRTRRRTFFHEADPSFRTPPPSTGLRTTPRYTSRPEVISKARTLLQTPRSLPRRHSGSTSTSTSQSSSSSTRSSAILFPNLNHLNQILHETQDPSQDSKRTLYASPLPSRRRRSSDVCPSTRLYDTERSESPPSYEAVNAVNARASLSPPQTPPHQDVENARATTSGSRYQHPLRRQQSMESTHPRSPERYVRD